MGEVALSGGTPGRVARRGDAVLRLTGPRREFVHRVLRRLDGAGAPRLLGVEADGREALAWIEGETGAVPRRAEVRSDAALASAARLLRRLHDALEGLDPGYETVCHNDAGPWNIVFRGHEAVALIDWDLAAPGARIDDVAYALWMLVPLFDDGECVRMGWTAPPDRMRRAALFLDAYRMEVGPIVPAVRRRQVETLRTVEAALEDPTDVWSKVDPANVRRDMRWLAAVDAVLFDVGNTLVREGAPGTPVSELRVELLEGVAEGLPELARWFHLGAVSNTATMREPDLRALLGPCGVSGLLEAVVTSCDVGARKPDPAALLEAARRLGVDPERILYVGDLPTDREAAAAAGMAFAWTAPDGPLVTVKGWLAGFAGGNGRSVT